MSDKEIKELHAGLRLGKAKMPRPWSPPSSLMHPKRQATLFRDG